MPYKTIEINNKQSVYQKPVKKSQFYKGFSSLDSTTSNNRLYDLELVKQDIINHFKTKKGERVMNPNFGCIIWDLLMEPLTDEAKNDLEADITRIANSDPRVSPTQINLIEYPNGYLLELTLELIGTDQSDTLKLAFDQEIGLVVQ
jgi:phage baseplate assembly protein W